MEKYFSRRERKLTLPRENSQIMLFDLLRRHFSTVDSV